MSDDTKSIGDILKTVLLDKPPKVRKNAIYEELQQHEKAIKKALKDGWSASQLAQRMHDAGVKGSIDRMRREILLIAGVDSSKGKKTERDSSVSPS